MEVQYGTVTFSTFTSTRWELNIPCALVQARCGCDEMQEGSPKEEVDLSDHCIFNIIKIICFPQGL